MRFLNFQTSLVIRECWKIYKNQMLKNVKSFPYWRVYLVALGKSFHQIIISLPHSVPRGWKSNFNMFIFINLSILQKHQFFMFFHYFEEQFNIRKNFAFIHSYNYGKKRILFKCKGVQHYICKERPRWTEIQVWKDREGGTHTSAKALLRRESKVTSEWLWMDGLLEL